MLLLIHGYGIGISSAFQTPKQITHVGFTALEELLQELKGSVFCWRNSHQLSLTEAINPLTYVQIYLQERQKSTADHIQNTLRQHIITHQPSTIITHSLGAHLILEQVNRYGLPDTVKHLVTIQADIPASAQVTHQGTLERLKRGELHWHNYYFPWDPALFLSSVHHLKARAGLVGLRHKHVNNRLFFSFQNPNLHLASIEDVRLADQLRSIISP